MIRILLIEDHVILREGLRYLLEMEPDFSIVGEAGSAADGLRIASIQMPDVIVTDIGLPGRSGLSIISELKSANEKVRILVLTAHCIDEYIQSALESGANAYVLKDASRADLIQGIRTIVAGQSYFSAPVAARLVTGFLGSRSSGRKKISPTMTRREMEVLKLVASANSNKRIAEKLSISIKTVEKHRSNLMRKLSLHSTAEVTLFAIRHELVSAHSTVLGNPPND